MLKALAIAATAPTSAPASAHRGHQHDGLAAPAAAIDTNALAEISESYNAHVAPIFQAKCGDCHGSDTHYPWYYRLPGARQLIDADIHEAKVHLDISHGFPFSGHGTPLEDIREISRITQDNSMPPARYWLLHPGARLSSEEKSAIAVWAATAESLLTK